VVAVAATSRPIDLDHPLLLQSADLDLQLAGRSVTHPGEEFEAPLPDVVALSGEPVERVKESGWTSSQFDDGLTGYDWEVVNVGRRGVIRIRIRHTFDSTTP
jgi:hypothetical protein